MSFQWWIGKSLREHIGGQDENLGVGEEGKGPSDPCGVTKFPFQMANSMLHPDALPPLCIYRAAQLSPLSGLRLLCARMQTGHRVALCSPCHIL